MSERLQFARAAYDTVPLYDPKRAPVALDLTDNTNLWGLPPHAERALREIPVASVTRYPTLYSAELKDAIADYVGVSPNMIVTGCGSDDILDSAMRRRPGRRTGSRPVRTRSCHPCGSNTAAGSA